MVHISRVSFEVNNDGVSRHINHGRVVPNSRKEIKSDEDTDFEIPTKERRYLKRVLKPPDFYGHSFNYN